MHGRRLALTVSLILSLFLAAQPQPDAAQSAPAVQAPPAPAQGRGGGPAVVSPQIGSDGRVTFRILAPNATTVTVGGDINGSLVADPNPPAPQPPAPEAQAGRGGGIPAVDDDER